MLPSLHQHPTQNHALQNQDTLNLFPDQLDDLIALNPSTCQHVLSELPNPVSIQPLALQSNHHPASDHHQNGLRKRGNQSPPNTQSDPKKLKRSPHFASPDLPSPSDPSRQPCHASHDHPPAGLLIVTLQPQAQDPISQVPTTPAGQEPDGLPHPCPEASSASRPDATPDTPPAARETGESTDLQPADPEPVPQIIRLPSPAPFNQPAPQPIQSHSPTSPTIDRHPQEPPSPPPVQIPGSPYRPDEHQSENRLHMTLSPPHSALPPSPLLPNQPIPVPSSDSHLPSTTNESLSQPPSAPPPSCPPAPSPPTSRSRISSLPALSSRPEIVTSSFVPSSTQRPRATSLASAEHTPPPPLGALQELPPPPPGQLSETQPDSLRRSPPPPTPLPSLRVADPPGPASPHPPTRLPRLFARPAVLPAPSSNHVQPAVTDENSNDHQPGHEQPLSPTKAVWTPKPGASPQKRYMFSSPLKAIQPSLAGAKAVVRKAGEGVGEQSVSPVKTSEQSMKSSPSKALITPVTRTGESSVKSPSKLSRILPSSLHPGRSTGGGQVAKAPDEPLLLGAPSSESTRLNNLGKRLQALKSSSARMRVAACGSSGAGGESAPRRAFEEPGARPRARRVTGGGVSGVGERRDEGLFRAPTAESDQARLAQLTERQTTRNRARFCAIRVEVVEMGCERPGSPEARFRKGAKNKQKKRATREEEQRIEEDLEEEELEIKLDTGKQEGRRRKVQWKDRVVGEDEEGEDLCRPRPAENQTSLKGILKPVQDPVDRFGNLVDPLPGTIVPELVKVSRRIWID